jgi:sec-independent protein translocase protein TatA
MKIASFFNLAGPDLIVILLIVLLLFGAKKLPGLSRGMGEAIREFLRARDEFASRFDAAKPDRKNANPDPGTAFGLAAVAVALLVFLLAVGARWPGR